MRARVASRKGLGSSQVRLWQGILGPKASSIRLRKLTLIGLISLILIYFSINLPENFETLINELFSAKNLGHLIAAFLSIWLGLRAAALAQSAIFSLDPISKSQKHILANALGLFVNKLDIQNIDEANKNIVFNNIGGPAKLVIPMESAVILESSWGTLRSVGPQDSFTELAGFERSRMIIDLRDQVVNIHLSARTKDGVRTKVEGARAVFSIARGAKEASLSNPYPFSKQAAMRLSRQIENISGTGSSDTANPLGHHGSRFIEQELQAFIGEFWLGELLAAPKEQSLENEGGQSHLFLARDLIRKQFIEYSRKRAIEQGIQINWIDIGTWKVDELAQGILQDYQDENLDALSFHEDDPLEQSKNDEINRLLNELIRVEEQSNFSENNQNSRSQMLSAYFGIIDGLRLRYENLLDEKDEELTILLRFLRLLGKRSKGN